WYVEGINVSEKFREYQLDALKMAKEKNLTWNSIYEILALSSIIVLSSPCPYPHNCFTIEEWDQIINNNPYQININFIQKEISHNLNEMVKNFMFNKRVQLQPVESGFRERLDSYVIDLRYDGLYRSWEFAKTKLVVEKSSMPSIESSIIHFLALEEQEFQLQ
ncbi:24472_t:CDS:2, partial [Entrophospora sp. SA101]